MTAEEYLSIHHCGYMEVSVEVANKAIEMARQEERGKSLEPIFEAERKWITSSGKNLDAPYARSAGRVVTLRNMLDDMEQRNVRACEQAQSLIGLTCEMFIHPTSQLDEVRKKERERATSAMAEVLTYLGSEVKNGRPVKTQDLYNLFVKLIVNS